jgi:hypothetical protein
MTSDLLLAFKDLVDFVVEHVNKLMQSMCVPMSARSTPTVIHGSNLNLGIQRNRCQCLEMPKVLLNLLRTQIGQNTVTTTRDRETGGRMEEKEWR